MIPVLIPMETNYWEDEFWVFKRNLKRDEYFAWLLEHDMFVPIDYLYTFVKCGYKDNHVHVFEFSKSSDAMLFKLTFSGV